MFYSFNDQAQRVYASFVTGESLSDIAKAEGLTVEQVRNVLQAESNRMDRLCVQAELKVL